MRFGAYFSFRTQVSVPVGEVSNSSCRNVLFTVNEPDNKPMHVLYCLNHSNLSNRLGPVRGSRVLTSPVYMVTFTPAAKSSSTCTFDWKVNKWQQLVDQLQLIYILMNGTSVLEKPCSKYSQFYYKGWPGPNMLLLESLICFCRPVSSFRSNREWSVHHVSPGQCCFSWNLQKVHQTPHLRIVTSCKDKHDWLVYNGWLPFNYSYWNKETAESDSIP